MEHIFNFVLNFRFSIHPSLNASTKTKLVGGCRPAPVLHGCRRLKSQLMYSLQVLFPKIDWIDRMIIAFKQHKTPVVQPVAGWSALTCSLFLCWGGFHLSSMWLICQHEKRHICLDMPNRHVSIEGFVPRSPGFGSSCSPERLVCVFFPPHHFTDKHRPGRVS